MQINKIISIKLWRYFVILLLIFSVPINAKELSLAEYLCQVKKNNRGLAGNYLTARGACQRAGEGRLLMRPTLFAEGQYLRNSYDAGFSTVPGTNNSLQTYKAGISQTTPYGVTGKVYYNYQHQTVNGLNALTNQGNITTSSPILELDVPLSRNFKGRETRAQSEIIHSGACLKHFSAQFNMDLLMADAETAYWHLALTRSIIAKQTQSLDRAIKIEQWVNKRLNLRLAEEADLLQAEAAVDAKRLDIQAALADEQIAEQNFNTLRGSCQNTVTEHLYSFHEADIPTFACPLAPGLRQDVQAAKAQANLAIANANLGIEKNKPDLQLFASYTLNGNNLSSNAAISDSFSLNYPTTTVGLRLSLPLDFCQLKNDQAAYRKEIKGAQLEFEQKVFENTRLFDQLVLKLQQAKKRLDIATQLESVQLRKLQAERMRLTGGKTTTYQVLLFEQDYAGAQISRLLIQGDILELMAQLKTFGAWHEPC